MTFLPAVMTVRFLAPLILIRGVGDLLCYQVLISSGNEKYMIRAYLAGAATNILLNIFLINTMKQDGAAIATIISEVVVNGSLLFISRRVVKPNIKLRFFGSILAGVGAMLLTILYIKRLVANPFLSIVFSVVIGAIVYFLIFALIEHEEINTILKKVKG